MGLYRVFYGYAVSIGVGLRVYVCIDVARKYLQACQKGSLPAITVLADYLIRNFTTPLHRFHRLQQLHKHMRRLVEAAVLVADADKLA
jgi:hypothetical protein